MKVCKAPKGFVRVRKFTHLDICPSTYLHIYTYTHPPQYLKCFPKVGRKSEPQECSQKLAQEWPQRWTPEVGPQNDSQKHPQSAHGAPTERPHRHRPKWRSARGAPMQGQWSPQNPKEPAKPDWAVPKTSQDFPEFVRACMGG